MPTYPSAGPDPDTPLVSRPYLDDGYNPSRGVLVSEPDMNTGDHSQAHENASRLAMAVLTTAGNGWIPAPVAIDGLSPITWTTGTPTDGLTAMTETPVTASAVVSGFLAAGMKLRCTVSAVTYYFIVTAASGAAVTLLGPVGQAQIAATTVLDAGSVFFSAQQRPYGWPNSPAAWTVTSSFPNDAMVTLQHGGGNSTIGTWRALQRAIQIPGGNWNLSYSMTFEVNTDAYGFDAAFCGLTNSSNGLGLTSTAPIAGMMAHAGYQAVSPGSGTGFNTTPSPTLRVPIYMSTTVSGAATYGLVVLTNSGSVTTMGARSSAAPVTITAVSTDF